MTGLEMSIAIHDVLFVQVLTSSMVLHMAVKVILGAEWRILLTAFPTTNECAVWCSRRYQGAGMIFNMVVQVLDSSKHTIAWSEKFYRQSLQLYAHVEKNLTQ